MTPTIQTERLEKCLLWLEELSEETTSTQSPSWLIDQIGMLCKALAFANGQIAVAKKILNEKKVTAYQRLAASSVANEKYFAPSLAKDYIASQCAQEEYQYDVAERCSRTLSRTIEALRSCLSALKTEMQTVNYH